MSNEINPIEQPTFWQLIETYGVVFTPQDASFSLTLRAVKAFIDFYMMGDCNS